MQNIIIVDRKTGKKLGGPFTPEEYIVWVRQRLANREPTGVLRLEG